MVLRVGLREEMGMLHGGGREKSSRAVEDSGVSRFGTRHQASSI